MGVSGIEALSRFAAGVPERRTKSEFRQSGRTAWLPICKPGIRRMSLSSDPLHDGNSLGSWRSGPDVRRVIGRLSMQQPVLYIWHPSFADVIGRFGEALVVYHCYDEYAAFAGTDRARVDDQDAGTHERRLLSRMLRTRQAVDTSSSPAGAILTTG